MDIKTKYPRAYELIKKQVLKELNKSGKISTEIMNAVPVDSIVQNSIGASVRLLYEMLDKEGIYMTIAYNEDTKWTYKVPGVLQFATMSYNTRIEAEKYGFENALELLDKK